MPSFQAFDRNQTVTITRWLLFTWWFNVILTLHRGSEGHDLTMAIHLLRINQTVYRRWRDNWMSRPISTLFILYLFNEKCILRFFRLITLFGQANPWISWFLPILDSFIHLGRAWNQYFVQRIGNIHRLNSNFQKIVISLFCQFTLCFLWRNCKRLVEKLRRLRKT